MDHTDQEIIEANFRIYFGRDLPKLESLPLGLFASSKSYLGYLKKILYFTKAVIEPLERAGMKQEDAIVDIASGDGQMSVALFLRGYRNVVLFDLDQDRLKQGAKVIRAFVGESANPVTIRDAAGNLSGEFDVLISYQTIEHLSDTGNYSVASRKCQREFLQVVNRTVRRLCYFNAPNYSFPIDGHDTGLWFFHFLPIQLRSWLISRSWVKCSWSGIAQPISLRFLNRHLRRFRTASNYYAFNGVKEYLENYPLFNYVGDRMPAVDSGNLSMRKRMLVQIAKVLGKSSHYFLPTLSVILECNDDTVAGVGSGTVA